LEDRQGLQDAGIAKGTDQRPALDAMMKADDMTGRASIIDGDSWKIVKVYRMPGSPRARINVLRSTP
jgi:hypothetical protein